MSAIPIVASAEDITDAVKYAERNSGSRVYVARRIAALGQPERIPPSWGLTAAGPSKAVRDKAADKGQARPDGSFPIRNKAELGKAIKAYGRAGNKEAAKRHIIKRARALSAISMLPEDWGVTASAVTAAGWDNGLHPRGRDGQFIEKLGLLNLFDGAGYDKPSLRVQAVGLRKDSKAGDVLQVKAMSHGTYKGHNIAKGATFDVLPSNVESAPDAKARVNGRDLPDNSVKLAPGDRIRFGNVPGLEKYAGQEMTVKSATNKTGDGRWTGVAVPDDEPDNEIIIEPGQYEMARRGARANPDAEPPITDEAREAAKALAAQETKPEGPSKMPSLEQTVIKSPAVNTPGKNQPALDEASSTQLDQQLRDSLAEFGIDPKAAATAKYADTFNSYADSGRGAFPADRYDIEKDDYGRGFILRPVTQAGKGDAGHFETEDEAEVARAGRTLGREAWDKMGEQVRAEGLKPTLESSDAAWAKVRDDLRSGKSIDDAVATGMDALRGGNTQMFADPAGPSDEEKVRNAETMFGTNSKQHLAAKEKYGDPDVKMIDVADEPGNRLDDELEGVPETENPTGLLPLGPIDASQFTDEQLLDELNNDAGGYEGDDYEAILDEADKRGFDVTDDDEGTWFVPEAPAANHGVDDSQLDTPTPLSPEEEAFEAPAATGDDEYEKIDFAVENLLFERYGVDTESNPQMLEDLIEREMAAGNKDPESIAEKANNEIGFEPISGDEPDMESPIPPDIQAIDNAENGNPVDDVDEMVDMFNEGSEDPADYSAEEFAEMSRIADEAGRDDLVKALDSYAAEAGVYDGDSDEMHPDDELPEDHPEVNFDLAERPEDNMPVDDALPESPEYIAYEAQVINELRDRGYSQDDIDALLESDTGPLFIEDLNSGLSPSESAANILENDSLPDIDEDVADVALPEPGNADKFSEAQSSLQAMFEGGDIPENDADLATAINSIADDLGLATPQRQALMRQGREAMGSAPDEESADAARLAPMDAEAEAAIAESQSPTPDLSTDENTGTTPVNDGDANRPVGSTDASRKLDMMANSAMKPSSKIDYYNAQQALADITGDPSLGYEDRHKQLAALMTQLALGGKQRKRYRDLLDEHLTENGRGNSDADGDTSAALGAQEVAAALSPDNPLKEALEAKAGVEVETDKPPKGKGTLYAVQLSNGRTAYRRSVNGNYTNAMLIEVSDPDKYIAYRQSQLEDQRAALAKLEAGGVDALRRDESQPMKSYYNDPEAAFKRLSEGHARQIADLEKDIADVQAGGTSPGIGQWNSRPDLADKAASKYNSAPWIPGTRARGVEATTPEAGGSADAPSSADPMLDKPVKSLGDNRYEINGVDFRKGRMGDEGFVDDPNGEWHDGDGNPGVRADIAARLDAYVNAVNERAGEFADSKRTRSEASGPDKWGEGLQAYLDNPDPSQLDGPEIDRLLKGLTRYAAATSETDIGTTEYKSLRNSLSMLRVERQKRAGGSSAGIATGPTAGPVIPNVLPEPPAPRATGQTVQARAGSVIDELQDVRGFSNGAQIGDALDQKSDLKVAHAIRYLGYIEDEQTTGSDVANDIGVAARQVQEVLNGTALTDEQRARLEDILETIKNIDPSQR